MIQKFVDKCNEKMATQYDAGKVLNNGNGFIIGFQTKGAEETFSVGQPIYDDDNNLMGYLGIGLYEHLDYATDIRIPCEHWKICLPTKYCIEGKHVNTYYQMIER